MARDGVRAEEELVGDLFVRHSITGEAGDFDLTLAQANAWPVSHTRGYSSYFISPLTETPKDLARMRSSDASKRIDCGDTRFFRCYGVIDVAGHKLGRDVWTIGREG